MIKVLIVDDSNVVAMLLKAVLSKEPDIEVVGRAENGREALEMVQSLKPDLVTMDVQMPEMNGFEATHAIMDTCPTPVMLVSSSVNAEEVHSTFQAIDEGAVAVVEQPQLGGGANTRYDPLVEFLRMVRLMSHANVEHKGTTTIDSAAIDYDSKDSVELIAIASAEGGLHALNELFAQFDSIKCPVIINQQLAPGFLEGLVTWLKPKIKTPLKLAENGEVLKKGTVYITPDHHDMSLSRNKKGLVCELTAFEADARLSPSADILFESIGEVCADKAVGVILSGNDNGINGLLSMKKSGAVTIAQDSCSALINEGPGQAIEKSAADYVLSPSAMVDVLKNMAKR